jgi:hypothetical protein
VWVSESKRCERDLGRHIHDSKLRLADGCVLLQLLQLRSCPLALFVRGPVAGEQRIGCACACGQRCICGESQEPLQGEAGQRILVALSARAAGAHERVEQQQQVLPHLQRRLMLLHTSAPPRPTNPQPSTPIPGPLNPRPPFLALSTLNPHSWPSQLLRTSASEARGITCLTTASRTSASACATAAASSAAFRPCVSGSGFGINGCGSGLGSRVSGLGVRGSGSWLGFGV